MKVKEILNYNRIIKQIIDNEKGVSALVKFKLLGLVKQFQPIVADYETIREEKISEYGTTNDQGIIGIFTPKEEDFETKEDFEKAMVQYDETIKVFYADLDSILESESDIKIKKFKADEIMNAGLSSECLLAIYNLIEE